jgi:Tfp pilus assembly protein PilX
MKNFKSKQIGAALAIGMLLLLIITVVGITSMKSAMLQEKMSANLTIREIIDSASLTQLVAAENLLFNYYQVSGNTVLGEDNPYSGDYDAMRVDRDMDDGHSTIGGVSIKEKYLEILGFDALKDEPTFVIEYIPTGGSVTGEFDSETDNESVNYIQLYKIISKANDAKGNLYSAFESVMSVRTN